MTMKRKLLAILVCAALSLSLTACANNVNNEDPVRDNTSSKESSTSSVVSEPSDSKDSSDTESSGNSESSGSSSESKDNSNSESGSSGSSAGTPSESKPEESTSSTTQSSSSKPQSSSSSSSKPQSSTSSSSTSSSKPQSSSASSGKPQSSSTSSSKPQSSTSQSGGSTTPQSSGIINLQGEKFDFPETSVDEFAYKIKDGKAVVTEYFGKNPDVHIPDTIEGCPTIMEIGRFNDYFRDHNNIKRLILPATITQLVPYMALENLESVVFEGDFTLIQNIDKLKNVYVGGEVLAKSDSIYYSLDNPWGSRTNNYTGLIAFKNTIIKNSKFNGVDVVIPEGIKFIAKGAFSENKTIKSIKLPGTLKEIGDSAFKGSSIQSCTFSEGLEKIGAAAFMNSALKTANALPNSLKYIEPGDGSMSNGPFFGTPWQASLANSDELCISGKWLLFGRKAYGNVTVPNGVTYIAPLAFYGAGMQNITLPDGLVYIGNNAFERASFKKMTVPDGVAYIGNGVFELAKFEEVSLPANVEFIDQWAFNGSSGKVTRR